MAEALAPSPLVRPPKTIELSSREKEVFKHFQLARSGSSISPAALGRELEQWEDPFELVLRLASASGDFALQKGGLPRGLAAALVLALPEWLETGPALRVGLPSRDTQDKAFFKVAAQPSLTVMRAAFRGFSLAGSPRYHRAVIELCEADGDYRAACDAAVALELFNQFPIQTFCLPLLLQSRPASLEAYLAGSPVAAREVVAFLDGLLEDNLQQVSRLCHDYPALEPTGSSRLVGKPLEKMIKKYADMFSVDKSLFPITMSKRASADLYYWVKQMFTQEEHAFTLLNWRELIEHKVRGSEVLQHQLISNLFSFDIAEARHWNAVLGLDYFDDNNNIEEFKSLEIDVKEEVDETCFKLTLPFERLIVVDTKELFEDFLKALEKETKVGVDAEFVPSINRTEINLLQIATPSHVYLIDFEILPGILEAEELGKLSTLVFQNQQLLKVGFGLLGDIQLLSASAPALRSLPRTCRAAADLAACRTELQDLLQLPPSSAKGLAGLCESVLGKPLSKLDQISDWSRRPLRNSQLVYAALDASVCLQIHDKLLQLARDRDAGGRLAELLHRSQELDRL